MNSLTTNKLATSGISTTWHLSPMGNGLSWVLLIQHRYIPSPLLYCIGSNHQTIRIRSSHIYQTGMGRRLQIPASDNGLCIVARSLPPSPGSSKPVQDPPPPTYREDAQEGGMGLLVPHFAKWRHGEPGYQGAEEAMGGPSC